MAEKMIPAWNHNANEKVGTGREGKFWQDQEALKQQRHAKLLELRKRTAETANLKKEVVSSPEDDMQEFMRENFDFSLSSIEHDFEKIQVLSKELKNKKDELKANLLKMKMKSLDERLKSLQELYKKDEFPELLDRMKNAVTTFSALKEGGAKPKLESFPALHKAFSNDISMVRKMVVQYSDSDGNSREEIGNNILSKSEKILSEISNQIEASNDPHEKADFDNLRIELNNVIKNVSASSEQALRA